MELISTYEGVNVYCIFSSDFFFVVAHLDSLDTRYSNFAVCVSKNVSNELPKF